MTKDYIEENLKKICEGEGLPVDEVIYFVVCVCLWAFERINGLLIHA